MMTLAEAAAVMRGQLRGDDAMDARFGGVSIDSRRTGPGDLFVAIDGGDGGRDGHDFVDAAAEMGAVAALVSRAGDGGGEGRIAQIQVADTTAALGQLGAHWRRRFELPLVAVTGSNGKTTVTALIASIFNAGGDCLAPRASFNNQWGVPLTLLRLREKHPRAVVEMGMNHAGEIARLTAMARPTVAVVNNVAPAHLAGFDDLHGVATAKAEIFQGLSGGGEGGVAVLNADDDFYAFFCEELGRLGVTRIVRFTARDAAADIRAAALADGRIEVEIGGQTIVADWKLPGAHNIANAAAAAAAAHAAGASPAHIAAGLGAFPGPFPGRLFTFTGARAAAIIDDSYNANPASMRVALAHLASCGDGDGKRIAVLGPMAELGAQSAQLHRQIGEHARDLGIAHLLCLAESAAADIDALLAGHGGGERFTDIGQLIARLMPLLDDRATVLIKGSRSTDMGRVVDKLKPPAVDSAVADAVADTVADPVADPNSPTAGRASTVAGNSPGGPPC